MVAVYLDHAATTPMRDEVIAEMTRVMKDVFGNPSSVHNYGRKAYFELELAREEIAQAINSSPSEIVFNGGGTEGDNTAIIQTALRQKNLGNHIISTNAEHSAVNRSLEYLETLEFEVTRVPVDKTGKVEVSAIKEALRPETILATIIYGNNEVGTINPIKEIGDLLLPHQALFHTDAVQVFGSELIDVKDLNVDYLSMSGHKINGPKGTGFLYIKKGSAAPTLLFGGNQEDKRRAGTENIPSIVGLKKAVMLLTKEKKQENQYKYNRYRKVILEALKEASICFEINQSEDAYLPAILNIWIKGVPNHILSSRLDLLGFAISIGSACRAGLVEPSPTILAMKPDTPEAATESIRISFGYGLSEDDVTLFSKTLVETIKDYLD